MRKSVRLVPVLLGVLFGEALAEPLSASIEGMRGPLAADTWLTKSRRSSAESHILPERTSRLRLRCERRSGSGHNGRSRIFTNY
jgi:hypothetical protein